MISGGIAYRGFRQQTLGWENKTDMGYLYNGTLYVTNNVMWMFMPTARKPARRFCVFFFIFPPWGLPKLGNFHFPPPVGAPQAREFSLFPPVGAPQAREFSLSPRGGSPS